VTSRSK